GLTARSASHPSLTSLLQSSKPGLQAMLHWPAPHPGTPWFDEQTLPQAPQFIGSSPVFFSHPSATWPLQSVNPALHWAILHWPDVHAPAAFAGMQLAPQAPQVLMLVP